MTVIGGLFAVVLGSIAGGVLGGVTGHVLGAGEKNAALQAALYGAAAGGVATLGALAWFARTGDDRRMVGGGVIALAVEAAALAWLITSRAP
jgi:hypothetical protein